MAVFRTLLVIGLLLPVGCRRGEAPPPLPPPPDITGASTQLTGCYEHVAASGEPPVSHRAPFSPPERFSLTNELNLGTDSLGAKIIQPNPYKATGHWERTVGDAIRLTWTNGSEGVRVTLQPSIVDRRWRGQTEGFSNMGGVVVFSHAVVVRRVHDAACREK